MKTPWDADIAAKWQQLMSEWEQAREEHELAKKDIAAETTDGTATSASMQRLAKAEMHLERLQADIDLLVAQRKALRHPEDRDYTVATPAQDGESAQLDDSAVPKISGARNKI